MSDQPAQEIQINIKGPSELKLQINITTDKTVLELKEAIAAKSDVEAGRQRLIYSGIFQNALARKALIRRAGRVLKDEDQLSLYKIQSSHTIHMVKGAARSGGPSTAQPAAQPLPTMQTGQNPHDPLTQLNGHQGFGLMAGLNPFSGMGVNQNDPNMMQTMMNSPEFLQQMSAVMSNPAVLDQIIASNPQLAAMGPQVRELFQSERFRQLVSNPQQLQQMMQMASLLGGAGGMQTPAFPAPGNPSGATNQPSSTDANSPPSNNTPNPLFPFLFPGTGQTSTDGSTPPAANPFGVDPALMQQMLGMGAGSGWGSPQPPADTRPPEERFQVQLQQLQDMGFTNASQNIRALLATGGNVHSAIEYILSGGGL